MIDGEVLRDLRLTAGLSAEIVSRIATRMVPVHVSGGQWLFRQGDVGDALYLIQGGRLEVVRSTDDEHEVIALLQAGDSLGELALLEGGVRSAGARAVRDCDLLRLHRDDFTPLLADPAFASALLAHVTRMLRAEPPRDDPAARRAVIAVVGSDPAGVSELVDALHQTLLDQQVRAAVLRRDDMAAADADGAHGTSQALDELEHQHEIVLLDGGGVEQPWSRVCTRQADRVLLLPDLRDDPQRFQHHDLRGCDLVLGGATAEPPWLLDRWDAALEVRTHHVLRPGHRSKDLQRTARRLSGRALGLTLSGGGARGMAHIGVLAALEETGTTIDRYGGTSMGALVGALAATGRPAELLREIAVREFVRGRPFADYTVPRTSMIRGRRAERMLQRLFGELDIRHLPRPYFAISADLVQASKVVHRRGELWDAVACSISLPGYAPPRLSEGRVLVDGGVLDNLPVGEMAADGEGQVIAVDLTLPRAFMTSHGQPRMPGIVEVLSTTMALANLQQVQANRSHARLVIEPQVADVELLDFSGLQASYDAGHRATMSALAGVDDLLHPVAGQ